MKLVQGTKEGFAGRGEEGGEEEEGGEGEEGGEEVGQTEVEPSKEGG